MRRDVFRFPVQRNLFCAFVGTGTQLMALALAVFGLACMNLFYPYNRGGLYTALIVLYAATSGIAGYSASSYYRQMEGTNWVRARACLQPLTILEAIFRSVFVVLHHLPHDQNPKATVSCWRLQHPLMLHVHRCGTC